MALWHLRSQLIIFVWLASKNNIPCIVNQLDDQIRIIALRWPAQCSKIKSFPGDENLLLFAIAKTNIASRLSTDNNCHFQNMTSPYY